ncbi:zinc dependent phospholipase C family protein [Aquirufa sp. ROCK2-A2]
MKNNKLIIIIGLCVITFISASWGFLAHKTLQQISIYQLPDELGTFFYANQDYLVQNSIRPDVRRKDDKTEDCKHYLDMDAHVFGPNYLTDIPHDFQAAIKKYSIDSLRKEGLVPWEVNRVYGRLVNAFKHNMKDSVLFYAADLGHYVADAHVPLHTTKNHDGQLTGQKGMHVLWESLVPEEELVSYQLYVPTQVSYIKNPQDFIFQILHESHAMLPEMFRVEKEVTAEIGEENKHEMVEKYGRKMKYYTKGFIRAYGKKLGPSIQQRMLISSNRVASFWYSAWKDAGSPDWVKKDESLKAVMGNYSSEKEMWKSNQLIKQQKLISLQTKSAE